MGTTEIIIVFAALMVLIAFVTIGIDWIGKPLKNRRFIARLYRFEDEKLPLDRYGNLRFEPLGAPQPEAPIVQPPPVPLHAQGSHSQPPPVVVARVDGSRTDAGTADDTALGHPEPRSSESIVPAEAPPAEPAGTVITAFNADSTASSGDRAVDDEDSDQTSTDQTSTDQTSTDHGGAFSDLAASTASLGGRSSAFSDSLESSSGDDHATAHNASLANAALLDDSQLRSPSTDQGAENATEWTIGMALDVTVQGDQPSLAVKATRFWLAMSETTDVAHYGKENLERLAQGKAPRRRNPRTGRNQAMQLTGLRQASDPNEVHIHWPGESVDPWSAG